MKPRLNYHWPEHVEQMKKRPYLWVMVAQDVPVRSALRIVRLRKHPALIVRGRWETRITNPYRDEDGQERGILWMRYHPLDT